MAHHCREHWASQHTWQTMPVAAAGQRSAGSGIGSEQAEQEGMVVGSAIDAPGVRTIAGLQVVLAAGAATGQSGRMLVGPLDWARRITGQFSSVFVKSRRVFRCHSCVSALNNVKAFVPVDGAALPKEWVGHW